MEIDVDLFLGKRPRRHSVSTLDLSEVEGVGAFIIEILHDRSGSMKIWEIFAGITNQEKREVKPTLVLHAEATKDSVGELPAKIEFEMSRILKNEWRDSNLLYGQTNNRPKLQPREFIILVLANEHATASPAEYAAAVRDWMGFKPKERWWLSIVNTTVAGNLPQAHPRWRQGLLWLNSAGLLLESGGQVSLANADAAQLPDGEPRTAVTH